MKMKKTLKFALLTAVAVLSSTSAWAANIVGKTQQYENGLKYTITAFDQTSATKTAEVSVSQNDYAHKGAAALNIPSTITFTVEGDDEQSTFISGSFTFKVTAIEDDAFAGVTNATSITIGENVKTIGERAFAGCTGVTSVSFPATLIKIKGYNTDDTDGAFYGCTALAEVTFAASTSTTALDIEKSAFYNTAIVNLDLSPTNMTTLNKLFEDGNVDLKTVTLPKTIVTLEENALANNILLNRVNFATYDFLWNGVHTNDLTTLKAGSLSNTLVQNYDFSSCANLTDLSTANPFVNTTITVNQTLKTVTLPTYKQVGVDYCPVTAIGTAFANCEALTDINNLNISQLSTVVAGAFAGDKALTALEFPTTLQAINGTTTAPFEGCVKLATLTFNSVVADALKTLSTTGIGGNNLYNTTDVVKSATQTNAASGGALKTLYIKGDFAGKILANAFANCTNLTTVEISNGKEVKTGATIAAGAIQLSNTAASTVTIGKLSADLGTGGIVGPTGTIAATVTVGDIALAQTAAIVTNNIGEITLGAISVGVEQTPNAFGKATTITFGGNIAGSIAASTVANDRLTTINFGKITIANVANKIAAAAFDDQFAPNLATINWNPAAAPTVKVFDIAAFWSGGSARGEENATITFNTTEGVADLYGRSEAQLYNIKFVADLTPATPTATGSITVAGLDGGTYYWGIFKNTTGGSVYINDNNNEEDAIVYSAFVDGSEQAIYWDPLARNNHRFIIANGQAVAVRVKGTTAVPYYSTAEASTMRYDASSKIVNDLQYTAAVMSWDYISTNYTGKTLYANQNIAKVGYVNFAKVSIDNPGYVPAGRLFVETVASSEANLRNIFLDGSEDVSTIIERIKGENKVTNGAIYNLQGIRVDASYKGIVIKNGKKYLQK